MNISNEQMGQFIEEYQVYVNKIIQHTYFRVKPEIKEELRQVGLIGLWKGINAYYKREPKKCDNKEFINTICAYIRFEMADLFSTFHLVKIGGKQWRNFLNVNKLISANPGASEEQLKRFAQIEKLNYNWYLSVKKTMTTVSLDASDGKNDIDKHNYMPYYEPETKMLIDRNYINYIIDSALAGVRCDRDKRIIIKWLKSVYDGRELKQTELARLFGLSSSMVGVIISRFINICRFVRDCEREFQNNPEGCLYFPEIKENRELYNGEKIAGVKWILRNKKWKVEITVGKNKSVFIGYFKNYLDAVRARRDAEIQYRGKSDIKI